MLPARRATANYWNGKSTTTKTACFDTKEESREFLVHKCRFLIPSLALVAATDLAGRCDDGLLAALGLGSAAMGWNARGRDSDWLGICMWYDL